MGSPRPWPARLPSGFSICSPTRIGTRSSPGRERVPGVDESTGAPVAEVVQEAHFYPYGLRLARLVRQRLPAETRRRPETPGARSR